MIDRSKTRDTPRMAVAFEAANLFGTRVAETNLASVQYETQQQAGHMNANDPIKLSVQSLASRGPSTYAIRSARIFPPRTTAFVDQTERC